MEGDELVSQAVVTSRDLMADVPTAQHLALMFERILVWPLERHALAPEEGKAVKADIDYLASNGAVVRLGFSSPIGFGMPDGTRVDPGMIDSDYPIHWTALPGPGFLPEADPATKMVWALGLGLRYKNAPVTAVLPGECIAAPTESATSGDCIELVLPHIPFPVGASWDDILQFRQEEETIRRMRSLRAWIRRQAFEETPPALVKEELETMLDEYRRYMTLQRLKFGEGVISTLVTVSKDFLKHALDAKLGTALTTLLDIRARRIALGEAELLAPGREVSYVALAQDRWGRRRE